MLPNEITLAVDEENDDITADHIYTRYEEYLNRSVYIGPSHTLNAKNTLTCYRTYPKPNGNFKGVAKSALKFSTDITVEGVDGVSLLTAPIILEVGTSLPVGTTPAQSLLMRQKGIALLDYDAIVALLMDSLMI